LSIWGLSQPLRELVSGIRGRAAALAHFPAQSQKGVIEKDNPKLNSPT
jgi:hypothetical protein